MVEEKTTVKKTTTGGWGSERGEDTVEHTEKDNPVTGKHTEKTVEKHVQK